MPLRWCEAAELRRKQIESNIDLTFEEVFKPLFVEWICGLNPNRVIEIGAGTGHLSKALSNHSFMVTAIEPSPGMYKVASEVLAGDNVELLNCSSFDLSSSRLYDVAFSHLVAHVVEDLAGYLTSVSSCLTKGGHFVFSIPHPCFYNSYKSLFGSGYNYMTPMSKEISFSITKDPNNKVAGVPYHHRPLSTYINAIVKVGFAIESFHETYPPSNVQLKYGKLWDNPRYCAFFCKKP